MHTHEAEQAAVKVGLEEASRLCRDVQSRMVVEALAKADRSPVTVADFGSQALVCRAIREAFPDDPIVAEEDGGVLRKEGHASLYDQVVQYVCKVRPEATPEKVLQWIEYGNAPGYSHRFWTLDPIDGTKGFLRKQQYAIALALIEGGVVVLSGLACPNMDEGEGVLFMALRGQGSWQAAPFKKGIKVSGVATPSAMRFCESVESAHSAHHDAVRVAQALGITRDSVRLDSQAKYAVVARGEADIYLRLPTRRSYVERIWDHAAGSLLATEAGGCVTDCTGAPLDFSCGKGLDRNRGIVATNGQIHSEVVGVIRALGIGQPVVG